ncbi:MAG: hypothetical protein ACPL2N_04395 [Candidatus Cryosericum sp.]
MANGTGFYYLQSAYVNVLDEQGVVSPETALPLDDINNLINPLVRFGALGSGWLVVNKLVRYGVLQECPDGRYYLNQDAAENLRNSFSWWLPW